MLRWIDISCRIDGPFVDPLGVRTAICEQVKRGPNEAEPAWRARCRLDAQALDGDV